MNSSEHSARFMTIREMAALLHLEYLTVWKKVKLKQIPAVKVGRRVLIERADVERMIAAGRKQPAKQHANRHAAPEAAPAPA